MRYTGRIILLSLSVAASLSNYFFNQEFLWLEIFVNVVFAAIAWLVGGFYDKFKFLSYHDYLTHVYNRRYGDFIFPKILSKARQKNKKIGIFNIDINHFKRLNDTYGHEFGDFVLEELAGLLKRHTCQSDVVIRWGGDEFLIVSPDIQKGHDEKFVESIHQAVEREFNQLSDQNLNIGLSIGFSIYPEDGRTFDELLSVADKKMYKMKTTAKKAPSV